MDKLVIEPDAHSVIAAEENVGGPIIGGVNIGQAVGDNLFVRNEESGEVQQAAGLRTDLFPADLDPAFPSVMSFQGDLFLRRVDKLERIQVRCVEGADEIPFGNKPGR